jgi:hypothetical protein
MSQFTVITAQQFADKSWLRSASYAFAANANAIPVVAAELANLVPALPLGFVKAGTSFELAAITSLLPGTNLFVSPTGEWLGRYIPAALRGYPFRVMKAEDGGEDILCVNESSGLVVEGGGGEPFFDQAGRPSQALSGMLDFISQLEVNRVVTQAAVNALQAADLIQAWPLQAQNGDRTVAVEGIYRIDEAKLNALSDDAFLSLRVAGGLPLAYAQLLSTNQFSMLQMAEDIQKRLRANALSQLPQKVGGLDGFSLLGNETLKFN